jgi:capsular polysaccharide biosynthesis protein
MELREYIRIIRQWGWIVVLLAVLAAGGGYAISERMTPIYEANVVLSVRPARADWDLGQSVGALLRSLGGDIATHRFLQQVLDRYNLAPLTTDKLLDGRTLFVKAEAADFTIAVTVRDPNPDLAMRTVNAVADLFAEQRREWNEKQALPDRIEVEIRDYARFAGLYSPNKKLNVAAGGVLGAMIGALVVAVIEWLHAGVVRSADDLDRLGVRVLGALPRGEM